MPNPKSDSEVEYVATVRDDGQCYSLTVLCPDGLTETDYADALVSFADDIYSGRFSFDGEMSCDIVSEQ